MAKKKTVRKPIAKKRAVRAAPKTLGLKLPALGAIWPGQGGLFAGIARDEDGGRDYALIVSPPVGDFDDAPWADACAKAAAFKCEGHSDYKAPTQRQLNLCFANVPEHFRKTWYWSSTQYSAASAWCQYVTSGHQYAFNKDTNNRVRAVRRVSLQ